MKYIVQYEEVWWANVEVEAKNPEEARKKAEKIVEDDDGKQFFLNITIQ